MQSFYYNQVKDSLYFNNVNVLSLKEFKLLLFRSPEGHA